jgi:hypothetical protein
MSRYLRGPEQRTEIMMRSRPRTSLQDVFPLPGGYGFVVLDNHTKLSGDAEDF